MTVARLSMPERERVLQWAGALLLGATLGFAFVVARRLGVWAWTAGHVSWIAGQLTEAIGPVWIPMLIVAARVAWLSARAVRTRSGRGRLGQPVRPEMGQIAPLFAALGLCGTVWGLSSAFEALNGGEFLTQLPLLLGGLGAAMTSTLVGLGMQIATLLLRLVNPAWSWVHVGWREDQPVFSLDERSVSGGAEGLVAISEALRARQPEALCIAFHAEVPATERAHIRDALWCQTDGAIPVREVLL
jgi:hypothetical protein